MAALDITVASSPEDDYAPAVATLPGAPSPGDLLLDFVSPGVRELITPPAGSTLLAEGDADGIPYYIYGKIAGESESASRSATISDANAGNVLTSARVEGVGSLVNVTVTAMQGPLGPADDFTLPASPASIGAGEFRAIAIFTSVLTLQSYVTVSGWSNGFSSLFEKGVNNSWGYAASRTFTGPASDVQSDPDVSGPPWGNGWVIVIKAGGGSSEEKSLAASITPAAALATAVRITLSASITPSASVQRATNRTLSASSTPAGSVARQASATLAASIAQTAGVARQATRMLSASVTVAGDALRQARVTLGASATPSASISSLPMIAQAVSATLTLGADVYRQVRATQSASVTPTAGLATRVNVVLLATVAMIAAVAAVLTGVAAGFITAILTLRNAIGTTLTSRASVDTELTQRQAIDATLTERAAIDADLTHQTDD